MGFLDSLGGFIGNLFGGGGGGGGGSSFDLSSISPEATQTAFQGFAPGGQFSLPDLSNFGGSPGGGFGDLFAGGVGSGFANIGKGLAGTIPAIAGAVIPAIGGGLAGLAIDRQMPGQPPQVNLVDPRQPQTIAGANMALERARNIQLNPTSFGLPGDPDDPSTPAGQKLYQIRQASRSADAARGAFTSGGSAARETRAVNEAVGNEYNRIFQDTMGTLSGQPSMTGYVSPAQENPWAKMLAGAVNPAVSKGLSSLLADWGMRA